MLVSTLKLTPSFGHCLRHVWTNVFTDGYVVRDEISSCRRRKGNS